MMAEMGKENGSEDVDSSTFVRDQKQLLASYRLMDLNGSLKMQFRKLNRRGTISSSLVKTILLIQ